jgi:PAS domain S-box-containing protein
VKTTIVFDPDGYIITWNAGGERINGYTTQEIIGQHISRFYTAEDIERDKPHGRSDVGDERRQLGIRGLATAEGWFRIPRQRSRNGIKG